MGTLWSTGDRMKTSANMMGLGGMDGLVISETMYDLRCRVSRRCQKVLALW